MSNDWFKFYESAIHNPKLLALSDALYRAWTILLCFASRNGGTLPAAAEIASELRIKPAKVAEWITKLKAAGLFDVVDGQFVPHNWSDRQYKVADPTAASRMHRYRQRKGVTDRNVTVPVTEDVTGVTVVTKTPLRTEIEEEEEVVAVDARARPLVGPEAQELADELLVIAGHSRDFVPPGWHGAAMRVQAWLADGWPREVIVAAVKGAAARKRGSPANSVQFFERAIADEIARQQAPLPKIEPSQVNHGTDARQRGGVAAAFRELREQIASDPGGCGEAGGNPVLRLSQ